MALRDLITLGLGPEIVAGGGITVQDILDGMNAAPPAVNVTMWAGAAAPAAPPSKAELDAGFLALVGADGDTLETLSDQLDAVSIDPQDVADALKLAPAAGAAAVGSAMAYLADIDGNVDAVKLITDTLDVSAVTQVAASSAGHLTITAGLTFDEAVTGLTIPADWTAAIWTLKYSSDQVDTAAVLTLRAENPAAGTDGLQRVNGAALVAPITAADGVLTVTQASGRIDIWLSDELTLLLAKATGLGWDVKFIDADDDSTGRRGTADVVLTETKAVT